MSKKILIVDDEQEIRSLLSEFLAKKGFSAITAKDGKEGLNLALKLLPDLIILDINMPNMDGFTVLERLKKSQKTISIPVVMLTARGDDESKIKASSSYCEYYITKPFEFDELEAKIKQLLLIARSRVPKGG